MKKPNFQEAKYQTTTLPLDIFGVVTLNPASSARKDQRCVVDTTHLTSQQAKLT